MKKLIIDLDDVICGGGFLELVNKFLKTSYTIDDVDGYYFQSLVPEDKLNDFYEFLLDSNMYNYIKIVPNAIEVIEKLNNKFEVYICSSFIIPNVTSGLGKLIKDKCDWIEKNLPFLNYNQMLFMSPKQLINADIRIDDYLKNLNGSGELKILFTAYHNKNIDVAELNNQNIVRANSWLEIENMLL